MNSDLPGQGRMYFFFFWTVPLQLGKSRWHFLCFVQTCEMGGVKDSKVRFSCLEDQTVANEEIVSCLCPPNGLGSPALPCPEVRCAEVRSQESLIISPGPLGLIWKIPTRNQNCQYGLLVLVPKLIRSFLGQGAQANLPLWALEKAQEPPGDGCFLRCEGEMETNV